MSLARTAVLFAALTTSACDGAPDGSAGCYALEWAPESGELWGGNVMIPDTILLASGTCTTCRVPGSGPAHPLHSARVSPDTFSAAPGDMRPIPWWRLYFASGWRGEGHDSVLISFANGHELWEVRAAWSGAGFRGESVFRTDHDAAPTTLARVTGTRIACPSAAAPEP